MWRPPERIRYAASLGRIPTREEARNSRLFSPLDAGPLQLKQRTWVPAMVPWRATDDGFVTDDVIDWYARFADGRPGAIVVEATGIRDVPSGPLLRIGHDRFLSRACTGSSSGARGQRRRDAAVHPAHRFPRHPPPPRAGQILRALPRDHRRASASARRQSARRDRGARRGCGAEPRRASPRCAGARASSKRSSAAIASASPTCICRISASCRACCRALFADAAARAREAGFDGVELHYAHAYTMASFLSRTNTRDDGYGGARENRVRLPLEVYAAVRAARRQRFCRRLPLPRRRMHRRRQRGRRRRVFRRRIRPRRHGLPLDVARRQVR